MQQSFAKFVLSFAILALALIASGCDGNKAPKLEVALNSGETINLNLPKKPILVNFWATSCPGCIAEMPHLTQLKNELGDRFEILAISMDYDPVEQVDAFIKANNYPFNFIKDLDGGYSQAFGGIKLTPTNFLVAPNGNIVYQKIGDPDFAFLKRRIEQLSPQL